MATIDELRQIRLKKLANIQRAGITVYPIVSKRTHLIAEILANWDELLDKAAPITIAGRIRSSRAHGALTFIDIEDASGKIQVLLRQDSLGEKSYEFFGANFDVGDFIEVRGDLFVAKRGEKTINAADYKMLAKSLRPLPEKWHGLQDVEERYRKRYLDLIFNKDVRKTFAVRTEIIKIIRGFLEKRGFMEVETPILQTLYGGAAAKPFKTHLNAFDMDVYLRIAPEIYLKELLVGGMEKVFEIGKCFRNEGVDKQHNPDFTMLEFYWAYADYKNLMKLTEELFAEILTKIYHTFKIIYQNTELNFTPPWPRFEYVDLLKKNTKIDYWAQNRASLAARAKDLGIEIADGAGKAEIADEIFKKQCRPKIIQPAFIIHYPAECKPLAKRTAKDSPMAANFQLIVNGFEIVNAYSEQNDPVEQAARLKEQEELFKQGFAEAQRIDSDFVEALEYGMPPAAGFGMGIDRLTALLTNSNSLREVILFPLMKPKN